MNNMTWLLKREFWEHRGGFLWAPFWTGVAVLALTLLGLLAGEVRMLQVNGGGSSSAISMLFSEQTPKQIEQAAKLLNGSLLGVNALFDLVMGVVLFFYLLGALYDDRRDRSALFWKSLPVSDAGTVISKVLMATVLIPLLVFALMLVTWLLLQILLSIFVLIHGGSPWALIWGQHSFLPMLAVLLADLPAHMLWALLAVGWLLLCSAAVRSKPFLWAVLIPVLFGIANGWIGLMGVPNLPAWFLWREGIARMLLGMFGLYGAWGQTLSVGDEALRSGNIFGWEAAGRGLAALYASPGLWIGAVVGIAMIAGAVWFRRRNSEV